jgi:cobalt-zinc-cadmium efflux system outer membrane protein
MERNVDQRRKHVPCRSQSKGSSMMGSKKSRARRGKRTASPVIAAFLLAAANSLAHGQPPAKRMAEVSPIAIRQAQVTERVQPAPPMRQLGLTDLEGMALANNPSVARAANLVGAARGNWVQVGLLPNPSVGYDGQQLGSGGLAEQQGVSVSQEVVAPGKLRLNRAVASREVARAEQELAAQRQRVLTDTRIAYYQVLLAQRRIDVTSQLVGIGSEGLKAADAIFQAQEGSRVDVLQAEVEVDNAEILRQNARNRHAAAWQSLTAAIGIPNLPPQPLAGDAFTPPRSFDARETLVRIQSSSPEVAAAVANIEGARLAVARARIEPRPNLSFQGLVNVIDNGIGGKPDGAVAVSVPLPVFNRNQGAVLRAQHELAAAQRALEQIELDLQDRLSPVFERYANASNQVDKFRQRILPRTQESLELTRKLYAAGEINYVNLLTVQRTFTQTHLSYLDSLLELRTAEAEIDGLLLSGSLQSR